MAYMKKMRKTKMRSKKNARKTKRIRGGMKRSAMNMNNQSRLQKQKIVTPAPVPTRRALNNNSKLWTLNPDLAQSMLNQQQEEEKSVLEKIGNMKIER